MTTPIPFPISSGNAAPTPFTSDAEIDAKMQEYARVTNNPPYVYRKRFYLLEFKCQACVEASAYALGVRRAAAACMEHDVDEVKYRRDYDKFADYPPTGGVDVHTCILQRVDKQAVAVHAMQSEHCCEQGRWKQKAEKEVADKLLSTTGRELCKKIKRHLRDEVDDFGRDEIEIIDALASILVKINDKCQIPRLQQMVDEVDTDCGEVCGAIDDVIDSNEYAEYDDAVRVDHNDVMKDLERARRKLQMDCFSKLDITAELLGKLDAIEKRLSVAFEAYETSHHEYVATVQLAVPDK
jgi:hypothetical protein